MGSTRRSFTAEYKAEAAAFVLDGGRTIVEVARDIGCHELTLGKWVKSERDARNARDDAAAAATDQPLTEAERAELIRLRGELKDANATVDELRMQVEFAKKVATWFPKEQQ